MNEDVSGVAITESANESAFRDEDRAIFLPLARLIRAGFVAETKLLETAFRVRAGSSEAYRTARARLKQALSELENT